VTSNPLSARLKSRGPVIDAAAAERAREALGEEAAGVWAALAPVFSASPYLTGLARFPGRLRQTLSAAPEARLEAILGETAALEGAADVERVRVRLRQLKGDLHLLVALADLGDVWDLDAVTGALTRFADAAGRAARSPACSSWPWANRGRMSSTIPATSTSVSSMRRIACRRSRVSIPARRRCA
jgi:glutamate-ammonia-ligase adenylyltransferase